ADSEAPRDGKFLENLGTYNPLLDPEEVTVKTERIKHWMENGATPTATVKTILKKKGFFTASP
ncbi:MAG: 30S ribosomal protein S16, partial [Desulfobacterales bacterium]